MLMSAKIPTVVEQAKKAIDEDSKCVVIGLQSTGESNVNQGRAAASNDHNNDNNDFSACVHARPSHEPRCDGPAAGRSASRVPPKGG